MPPIDELRLLIQEFAKERDWDQFHSPRNLAAALAVEVGELLEIFLWKTDAASASLSTAEMTRLRQEIGDVQIYLVNLSAKFGLDPLECASAKIEINRTNYPATRVRGSATKHSEYDS